MKESDLRPLLKPVKKCAELAVLRAAYPSDPVANAACAGWRAKVTQVQRTWIRLGPPFSQWFKPTDPHLSGVAHRSSREQSSASESDEEDMEEFEGESEGEQSDEQSDEQDEEVDSSNEEV